VITAAVRTADKHGMRLEKCARGNSGWELVSDHPAGGQVFLLMLYDQSLGLGMGSVWHYPCRKCRCITLFRKMRPCAIDAEPPREMLDDELAGITCEIRLWTH
jgi:hypothetical protein